MRKGNEGEAERGERGRAPRISPFSTFTANCSGGVEFYRCTNLHLHSTVHAMARQRVRAAVGKEGLSSDM